MVRKYYARFSRYGVYGRYGGHDEGYEFNTREARDEFVEQYGHDGLQYTACACTKKEAMHNVPNKYSQYAEIITVPGHEGYPMLTAVLR